LYICGNGVYNAPSSTGSEFNYNDTQLVEWLDYLHNRNAGIDSNKGERSYVIDYVNMN
jgi:hypothetical protein